MSFTSLNVNKKEVCRVTFLGEEKEAAGSHLTQHENPVFLFIGVLFHVCIYVLSSPDLSQEDIVGGRGTRLQLILAKCCST